MNATDTATRAARIPTLPDIFRAAFPRAASKRLAQLARRSHRTTEAWVAGRTAPDADELLAMLAACPRLRAAVRDAVEAYERAEGPRP